MVHERLEPAGGRASGCVRSWTGHLERVQASALQSGHLGEKDNADDIHVFSQIVSSGHLAARPPNSAPEERPRVYAPCLQPRDLCAACMDITFDPDKSGTVTLVAPLSMPRMTSFRPGAIWDSFVGLLDIKSGAQIILFFGVRGRAA